MGATTLGNVCAQIKAREETLSKRNCLILKGEHPERPKDEDEEFGVVRAEKGGLLEGR